MNKHILLVMKWLDDKDSVTQNQLIANSQSAGSAYDHCSAYATYRAAQGAYVSAVFASADSAAAAKKHVNEYFELTGENKRDYIDEIKGTKMNNTTEKPLFNQAMADAGDEHKTVECNGKIYQIDGLYVGFCNSLIQLKEVCNGEFIGIDASGNHYQNNWLISIGDAFPNAELGTTTKPPVELIDGECYEGIHKGNGRKYKGVYYKATDEIFNWKCSNPADFYINIKLLEVK